MPKLMINLIFSCSISCCKEWFKSPHCPYITHTHTHTLSDDLAVDRPLAVHVGEHIREDGVRLQFDTQTRVQR